MSSRSETEKAFRKEFAKQLNEVMRVNSMSLAGVARVLKVSKQSVHKYRKEKATPRADVVHRALAEWGISLQLQGMRLTVADFEKPHVPKLRPRPIQILLPAVIGSLENRNLEVKILKKKADSLDLQVRIRFSS